MDAVFMKWISIGVGFVFLKRRMVINVNQQGIIKNKLNTKESKNEDTNDSI